VSWDRAQAERCRWIFSTHPARLFTLDGAITLLTVAELGENGYPDSLRS
jgi:hypothetical protein